MGIEVGVFPGDRDQQTNPAPVSNTADSIKYVVEVIRPQPAVRDVFVGVREVELVKPGGTLVNVGTGPELPTNPYEGQVWILI